MAQKCVHKGCGKTFTDADEDCIYHPGPPIFHEGQKGWNCCKPRVLTFDEFLNIPPCTTGKHSTVDDTPAPEKQAPAEDAPAPVPIRQPQPVDHLAPARHPQAVPAAPSPRAATPEPESDSDNPSLTIPSKTTCRRRGCNADSSETGAAKEGTSREGEECVHHPGHPIFHEGSKGWSCCKKRVLDFDEFMQIAGCKSKAKHMFVGSGKKAGASGEKALDTVRHDFYQTGTTVHVSLYLKKISKSDAKVDFTSSMTVDVDLPTADNTRYKTSIPLYGTIDPSQSRYRILGTKLELTLAKADGLGWPVLRADERTTGEIIQTGKAARA
ncbi:MAG: hypothetical protein LQ340_000667 [Diploschistes diacapsis]|nr:MAG: hypothetical protein LQ340_000667 [Diploschistes diacapsis]